MGSSSSDTSHYENVPFEVPKGWCWCRLDEVADVARGGSPRPIKQYLTESPDGVNWIKIGDTTEGCKYIEKTVEKIIPEGVRHSRMVKEGDFLLTNSMSFGKPFILKTNGCIHDGWLVISPFKGSFDKDYLYYLLSSEFAYEQFSDKASGAVVSNLNKDKVAESLFPLPPFEEQKKIVCQIESIMNFIGQMENNIEEVSTLIDRCKTRILNLAIHGKLVPQDANDEPASELLKRINPKAVASCDNPHYENVPFEIPSSWAWCKVRDVADVARGGSPRPIKQYLTTSPNGVNWIKIGDAEEGSKYITKTAERIIPEGAKRSRYVKTGDFLLTNSMSFGKPYILATDGCIHDGWLVISPIDGAYDKNFLFYLLSSSFAYNQFSEKAGGAIVSNLNKDKVADSLFPLPPLAEQKRIVDMVEELYFSLEGIASTLQ